MKFSLPGIGGSLGECVVCGKPFILELLLSRNVRMIHVEGFNRDLPIHDEECGKAIQACNGDWKLLPDSPLRQEFEKVAKEIEVPHAKT